MTCYYTINTGYPGWDSHYYTTPTNYSNVTWTSSTVVDTATTWTTSGDFYITTDYVTPRYDWTVTYGHDVKIDDYQPPKFLIRETTSPNKLRKEKKRIRQQEKRRARRMSLTHMLQPPFGLYTTVYRLWGIPPGSRIELVDFDDIPLDRVCGLSKKDTYCYVYWPGGYFSFDLCDHASFWANVKCDRHGVA